MFVGGKAMLTITANQARKQIEQLVEEVSRSHKPILIKGKTADVVLVAEEDWRALQETLYLLSCLGMKESIREGMETAVEECAKELDW
jgi:prevent-host-death family protein